MTEHPDHPEQVDPPERETTDMQHDRAERETTDMQQDSEALESRISDVRADWERKKADPAVPGAAGDPEAAEGDLPPEANYTSRGD